MCTPPRDINGRVLPHDDPTINDEDGLLRRIPPWDAPIDKQGQRRLSSGLFSPSSIPNYGISVDLERDQRAGGIDPLAILPEGYGLARLTAGQIRAVGLKVGKSPTEDNPYHADIWRLDGPRLKKSQLNALKRGAEVLRWPDPPPGTD